MNHLPAHLISAEAKPLTRRALAKLKTRQALLGAGKQLFAERGYEAATVRDIASGAGMSTGAVFANFADKADLFSEILSADNDALAAVQRRASQTPGTAAQRLSALFAAAYGFHLKQLALFRAAQARAWTHEAAAEARLKDSNRQAIAMVGEILRQGVERREMRAAFDVDLAADLLWHGYIANYRLAIFEGADIDQLNRRMERQIDLVLKVGQA